ncbi:hypothetical protein [Planomonospora venezuelensis]|uniref:hypothetical protein n=1 Tax=Planomonospora venezuelensis TaxID=1999 RepID=UPI0031E57B1A
MSPIRSSTRRARATCRSESRRERSETMETIRSPSANSSLARSSETPPDPLPSPIVRQITAPAITRMTSTRSTVSPRASRASSSASGPRSTSATRSATYPGVNSGISFLRSARWPGPSMLSSTDGPSTGVHRSPGEPGPSLRKRSSVSTARATAASLTTTPSPGTRTTGPSRASSRTRG